MLLSFSPPLCELGDNGLDNIQKDISENAEADNGEIKEEGDTELKTDASLAQTSPEEAAPSEDVVPTQLEAEEEAPSKLIASGNAIIDSLFDR